VATLALTRPPLQPREWHFNQRDAPSPLFITRLEPQLIVPILDVAQQPERRAWADNPDIRVANARHDITDIMPNRDERSHEHALRPHEHALPQAPAQDQAYPGYVEPGWPAGRGLNARQVHLVDQHFVPAEFLLEFQDVICNMVARGPDPRPTLVPHYEVKERFTGLITDGSG